jgi:hypothetical protein
MHICTVYYGTTIKWPIDELSHDSCCKIIIPVLIKAYVADTVSILFFIVNLSLLLSVRSGILTLRVTILHQHSKKYHHGFRSKIEKFMQKFFLPSDLGEFRKYIQNFTCIAALFSTPHVTITIHIII